MNSTITMIKRKRELAVKKMDSDDEVEIVMEEEEQPSVPRGTTTISATGPTAPTEVAQRPNIDLNGEPLHEGQPLYALDLDSFEDKPWRKPGTATVYSRCGHYRLFQFWI